MLLFGPFAQQAVGTEILSVRTKSDAANITRSSYYQFTGAPTYIIKNGYLPGRLTFENLLPSMTHTVSRLSSNRWHLCRSGTPASSIAGRRALSFRRLFMGAIHK